MEEKLKSKENKVELCAITKEFAQKKLKELVENPATKTILDEYFMWVNVLKSPVDIIDTEEKEQEKPVTKKGK